MIVTRILAHAIFHWMHLIWIDTHSRCRIISPRLYLLFSSNFQANPIMVWCIKRKPFSTSTANWNMTTEKKRRRTEIDSIKYRLPLAILYRFFFFHLYESRTSIAIKFRRFSNAHNLQAIFQINGITFAIGLIHL